MTIGRSPKVSGGHNAILVQSGAPLEPQQWSGALSAHAQAAPGGVDVVMPVYRGQSETLQAIHRVLSARTDCPFRLVVIDDASPEMELGWRIAALADAGLLLALRSDRNLGFVATANRGMQLDDTRDVVLLNSDTEVFDGWLDRLREAACSHARIGTATPLSNAATILSYPLWLRDHTAELEVSAETLDRLCALQGTPPVDIPTAVGFCMYIRRDCLNQVGSFDQFRFGRGYGEENDFCMRAATLGWRHVAAVNTYVWHWGGRSFGDEKAQRLDQAMRTLRQLHPRYHGIVRDFIARDPLAPVRASLDIARIRLQAPRNTLGVGEATSGDGERGILELLPLPGWRRRRWKLQHNRTANTPNLPEVDLRRARPAAAQLLQALGVDQVRPPPTLGGNERSGLRDIAAEIGAAWEEG